MSPQLYMFLNSVKKFVKHHHPVVFISVVCLLLGLAIMLLYMVLTITFSDEGTQDTTIKPFDQKTIDKIKELHVSSDSNAPTLKLPSTRYNPFVE